MRLFLTFFLFAILLISVNVSFGQSIPDSLKTRFNQVNTAIEKKNGTFDDYFTRAEIFKSIGLLDQAISDYSTSITFDVEDVKKTISYLNRGNSFLQQKNYEKAISDYMKAIELSPSNSFSWNNLGFIQLGIQEYSSAEKNFKKAIELDNSNVTAFVNLTELYVLQKMEIKALEVCDLLIQTHPEPKSYIHKADYYQKIGKENLALIEWNKAVLISKDNPDILVERSKFKDDILNDDLGAVEDCKKAITKNSHNATYYYNLTRPLYDLENFDDVIMYSDEALRINPNYYEALIMRANTLDLYGKVNEAKRDYYKVIKVKPSDFEGYLQLSILYYNMKKIDSAQIVIKSFLKIDPMNYKMLMENAKLEVANKNIGQGIQSLKNIIQIFPDIPDAFLLLGYLQDSIGSKTEACENLKLAYDKGALYALSSLVEKCPTSIDSSTLEQYNLSKQVYDFEQSREYKNAVDVCSQLIKIAPDTAIYYYNRGKAYRYLEQHENAVADYQKAFSLDSMNIDFLISLAISYSYLDQNDKAIATYEHALNIDPTSAMCYYNLGNISGSKKDYEKAISYFLIAIEYKFNYGNAYLALGDCYVYLKTPTNACEAYKKAEEFGVSQAFPKRIRYCN